MGKIKMKSGNPTMDKEQEKEIIKALEAMVPVELKDAPIIEPKGGLLPSVSCVCPAELAAMNIRIDSVMESVSKLENEPRNENTKIDSYIKSNNETLKSMNDEINKLKTTVNMAKSEVKVVEKVIDCKHKDQTEKRQEIGLEFDRIEMRVNRVLRSVKEEKEDMEIENQKLKRRATIAITVSILLTLINIFI